MALEKCEPGFHYEQIPPPVWVSPLWRAKDFQWPRLFGSIMVVKSGQIYGPNKNPTTRQCSLQLYTLSRDTCSDHPHSCRHRTRTWPSRSHPAPARPLSTVAQASWAAVRRQSWGVSLGVCCQPWGVSLGGVRRPPSGVRLAASALGGVGSPWGKAHVSMRGAICIDVLPLGSPPRNLIARQACVSSRSAPVAPQC